MSNIQDNISQIIELDGNNKCADCGVDINRNNGWASITFGCVICVECAGVHRGVAGNQIRSFFLDDKAWKTNKNIEFFRKIGGNKNVNRNVWECHLPLFYINPKTDTFEDDDKRTVLRDFFIKSKYANQLFIPLSSREYTDTNRNPSITSMPISPSQTSLMYIATHKNNMKWSKKPQYLLLHSFFLSIYSLNKLRRNKCNHLQTFNLISLKLVIDDVQDDEDDEYDTYDDYEYYTFTITPNDHNQPILKCKCSDFAVFIKYVHQIRKTILYYKMYSKLIDIDMKKKPIDLNLNYKYFVKENNFIGTGKLFAGKSSYFYTFNNKLFTFHNNPLPVQDNNSTFIHAKRAWDIQKIDIIPDVNGERSGFKYGLLLIEPSKMIAIKFETQQNAITFYSKLYQSYTNIRGSYLVDFKYQIPIIVDVEDDGDDNKDDYSTPGGDLQDINDKNNDLSRYRLKSLQNVRPPQILEILAHMEVNNDKKSNEDDDDDDDEKKDHDNKTDNFMILKMKEMADKMQQIQDDENKNKNAKKNELLLLKLHIDDKNYITIPIQKHTKISDVIKKVIKRRNINTSKTKVELYYEEKSMNENEKSIYEILETDPTQNKIKIQFSDVINDNKQIKKTKSDMILIKLYIDALTYITVPIQRDTKQSDVIKKVIKRRNIDVKVIKCVLYFDTRELSDDDNLYEIISKDNNNINQIKIKLFDIDADGNVIIAPPVAVAVAVEIQNDQNVKQHIKSQILSINNIDAMNAECSYDDKSPNSPVLLQSTSNPASQVVADDDNLENDEWPCPQCTFLNGIDENFCRICGCAKKSDNNRRSGHKSIGSNHSMQSMQSNLSSPPSFDMQQHQLMMTYHFQEYQKIFRQLQFPSNMSSEQAKNLQIMSSYHYQQYTMMHELTKMQNEMNILQRQQGMQSMSMRSQSQASSSQSQMINPMNRQNQMQYLKLERYFIMDNQQKQMLSNNFKQIKDALIKSAEITLVDELKEFGINDCFRLIIPSDIPLPKRKNYWQNVLKISRESIGMCQEHLM